jgi:starch synthase (maltosyl-transferring)
MNTEQTIAEPDCGLAVVEMVTPETGAGRALTRAAGERIVVEAEIFAPENEVISAMLKIRPENSSQWSDVPMQLVADDRWRGELCLTEPGRYFYVIEAWVDHFKAWRQSLQKELEAGRKISRDSLLVGADLIEAVVGRATALDAERLQTWAEELRTGNCATGCSLTHSALDEPLAKLMTELISRHPDRVFAATGEKELHVVRKK